MVKVVGVAGQRRMAEVPTQPDVASAYLRNLVVERLLRMNARHATHAWLGRRSRPVGPHGLAFLYRDGPTSPLPVAGPVTGRFRVAAATRLVDSGPDVRDLPRLLYRLGRLAVDRYLPSPAGFDPRVQMANRHDPMSATSVYIGLGVSSLDSSEASWEQAQGSARSPLDLPGRCYAVLRDGTALLVERAGRRDFGSVRIYCTHDLTVEPGVAPRPWVWDPNLTTSSDGAEVWRQLRHLHMIALRHRVPATGRTEAWIPGATDRSRR